MMILLPAQKVGRARFCFPFLGHGHTEADQTRPDQTKPDQTRLLAQRGQKLQSNQNLPIQTRLVLRWCQHGHVLEYAN
jgi:hypothetical protein